MARGQLLFIIFLRSLRRTSILDRHLMTQTRNTLNWLERNKTLIRCGNYSTKKSISGEPTSFLDHVYLGCTQRQCEISKNIVDNYRTMFESRISAGRKEKLPFPQNLRISSWSYGMECHADKCVERYCKLANKTDATTLQSIYSLHR